MSKNFRPHRIMVAGGAGFIGSNLVEECLSQGHLVDCVDNLVTGHEGNLRRAFKNDNFRFIHGDICDGLFTARLARESYSQIYNLACPTGVPNIALLGEEMLLTSSLGTLNLLRIAEGSKARFLFASTAEVYGDPEVFPQSEMYTGNVDPVGPRSAYEEGKRFGEALTAFYARRVNLDTRIVRIFNTYGPGLSRTDARVIPQILYRLRAGQPVDVYGDGEQTRSFLYVSDLIRGLQLVMQRRYRGEVFNIGSDVEMSVNELYAAAAKVTGSKLSPNYKPHFIADHKRRLPDTKKVQELGWSPQVSLKSGLRKTMNFINSLEKPTETLRVKDLVTTRGNFLDTNAAA